jgi:hypothetical protein
MDTKMKEILLKRKFSSIEYMQEMVEAHGRAVEGLKEALSQFLDRYPDKNKRHPEGGSVDTWGLKVLPNFKGMQKAMEASLEEAKQGDNSGIRSCVGDLRGLSKDMDGVDWDWWDYVDEEIWNKFSPNLTIAEQHGENLYWTLDDDWRPGSIMKESITGPIDEQDLLRYLKPGETA